MSKLGSRWYFGIAMTHYRLAHHEAIHIFSHPPSLPLPDLHLSILPSFCQTPRHNFHISTSGHLLFQMFSHIFAKSKTRIAVMRLKHNLKVHQTFSLLTVIFRVSIQLLLEFWDFRNSNLFISYSHLVHHCYEPTYT